MQTLCGEVEYIIFNVFYLTEKTSNNRPWYNLRVRETHYCVSYGADLNKILTTLRTYVKKYKTEDRFMKALRHLEDKGKVTSPLMFETYRKEYDDIGRIHNDLIEETISSAFSELREEERINSPLNKTKVRLKKAGGVSPLLEEKTSIVEVVKEVREDIPKLLGKPKILKWK